MEAIYFYISEEINLYDKNIPRVEETQTLLAMHPDAELVCVSVSLNYVCVYLLGFSEMS